ncbi:hypothetical protein BU23DRAFT_566732 [Bimuria novae-zelandiae CBS 107.79]|uniref:Uncharacterized protein n=1 Tax=Bimuria novae-zelandiae CBS 107.79 TaxID=1447943 RepID=A0A6A5VGZ4_9PLEO|nr:hypothetical protein BU23DRAFT_566732 [Bimuria novae-zelandiae CBS 107.79]
MVIGMLLGPLQHLFAANFKSAEEDALVRHFALSQKRRKTKRSFICARKCCGCEASHILYYGLPVVFFQVTNFTTAQKVEGIFKVPLSWKLNQKHEYLGRAKASRRPREKSKDQLSWYWFESLRTHSVERSNSYQKGVTFTCNTEVKFTKAFYLALSDRKEQITRPASRPLVGSHLRGLVAI